MTGSAFDCDMIVAGGGLNSNAAWISSGAPFNVFNEFKSEYRCIAADLRNAYDGQSTGPLDVDRAHALSK